MSQGKCYQLLYRESWATSMCQTLSCVLHRTHTHTHTL